MDRRNALLTGAAGLAAVTTVFAADPPAPPVTPADAELDEVGALLAAHDAAFTKHDFAGVMACLADNAMIMGTGPQEVWSGPEELKFAYDNFFQGFDKGEQEFDYQFRVGGKSKDMGWLMTSGVVKGNKDGKAFSYPVNVSISVARTGGTWKIAGLHFSIDPGKPPAKE